MKTVKKLLIAMCMCLAVFLCTPNVMPDSFGSITAEAASKVKLNKKKATLYVGETLKLKVKGTKKKVKWSSNKKSVATVTSKGKVKAKKKGTATITAKVGGKKYKCKITVKSGISANKTSMQIDDTSAENVEITLKNGGEVEYSIADTNIVSCKWGEWSGNNIPLTIYGRKAGTTTITVRNTFTNEKINIKVTVIHKTIPVSNVTLSKSLLNMEVGDTEVLSATIYPLNADDNNVSWTSSNTSVATVNDGMVTAVSSGTATITACVGDKKACCNVTVNKNAKVTLVTEVPKEFSYVYVETSHIYSKVNITEVQISTSKGYDGDYDIKIYFSGEKTYDEDGALGTSPCHVGYKLRDLEGNVIASGRLYMMDIMVGDKFKNEESWICSVPGGEYTLELINYYI